MSSVKKNLAYNIAYQILVIILPIITAPYISRVLGPDGIGAYSYTNSIASYFLLVAMLGVNNYGNRSIAMVRDSKQELSKTFWSIYGLQFLTSLLSIGLYTLYLIFFVKNYTLLALIQMVYLLSALLDINWFFFGIEQFKLTVSRNIVIRIITVCLIFLLVKTADDLWIYAIIMTLGILISQGILWFSIRKYIYYLKPNLNEIIRHIRPNLVLFIPVVAISIYRVLDKIMLGAMSSITQVGFFENADKIISMPMGVITALGTVMLPKMSNLAAKGDINQSAKYIENSMQFILFLAFGLFFGLAAIAPVFAPVFFGVEFSVCGMLISFLSSVVVFVSWANVIRTQYLIPNCKDRIYIVSVILGAVVNVTLNLILIKPYGALGAVISTVAAEMGVAIYQTLMVRKVLNIGLYLKNGILFFVTGLFMFMIIRVIGNSFGVSLTTLIVEILVGIIFYLLTNLGYLLLTKNQMTGKILSSWRNK